MPIRNQAFQVMCLKLPTQNRVCLASVPLTSRIPAARTLIALRPSASKFPAGARDLLRHLL